MRTLLSRSLCLCAAILCGGQALLQSAPAALTYDIQDKEEAFLIRRIAEFWRDQDYKIVKAQITNFLQEYPKSQINDHLRGILGDLLLQENGYEEALDVYSMVSSADIKTKIALNKMQCHYELNQFEKLLETGSPFINNLTHDIEARSDEFHFLMGEGYFRSALSMEKGELQTSYLKKARPLYEQVLSSSFNDPTMFALAEIYRLKEENQKASTFFTQLAERHPDRREELLFHAALAQAEFDKPQAIETFSKIVSKEGSKAKDAALNRLILYFQGDRFDDVIEHYHEVVGVIDEDKSGTLDYIIGRSYFAKEDYENAATFLQKYIQVNQANTPELRNTLLMQLNCAQNLRKEDLYQSTMQQLESKFPEDSELPQAVFIHAMMLKEMGDSVDAEAKLESLIKNHPDFENLEVLYLEYGLVTFTNENWSKSHATLASFVQRFPESEHSSVAWKYFLSTSLNLLKSAENGAENGYNKQAFLEDLTKVLARKEVLNTSEEKQCKFLLGKISYELALYEQSLAHLNTYLETYKEDPSAAEAHLLVALCHHKLSSTPGEFCKHAEIALQQNPDLTDKASIHLELYNVYLSMVDKLDSKAIEVADPESEKAEIYEKAADHLFTAMKLQDLPVKLENRLWLANHYYTSMFSLPQIFEVDGKMPEAPKMAFFERSQALFESILTDPSHVTLATIDRDHLYLEWEALKFANILGRMGKYDKKVAILKSLIEQQSRNPQWDWKLKKESMLELAKSYEKADRRDDALETLEFISGPNRDKQSFVAEYANLHALRLTFDMIRSDQKHEDNAEVFKILNNLKEIQIRKTTGSEPLHLEAAMEYAWIRAQIAPEKESAIKYLFFLNRVKEDFNNFDDPMIANYHKTLKSDVEKKHIYSTYMKFLEAEILRTEALLASQDSKMAQSLEMTGRAKEIFEHLSTEQNLYYLQRRVAISKEALSRSAVY